MKKFFILSTAFVLTVMFIFSSCKKKGCTDELAINYFSKVKTDDGSCEFSTTRIAGKYSYTWNDTLVDTATVYSLERSHMKVEGGEFDYLNTNFIFLVTWSAKSIQVPDSICPSFTISGKEYNSTVKGIITSKDAFTVTYTQQIPTYNNPTVKKDTVLTYNFTRI